MSISVSAISFDAHDAAGLVHFWAQALHRTVNDGATEEFASIAADTDSPLGHSVMFHKGPRPRPSRTACTSTCRPPTLWPRPTG
jgi:hypothetical protein